VQFEIENRGKNSSELKGFEYNSFERWQTIFAEYSFIEAIQTDCSIFDYTSIDPIKLTFLDVDLYLPTKNTLLKVYEATVKGGVIVVDDVLDGTNVDGAYQAYMEFCESVKIKPIIIGNKCGVVYK
jgi:hypothetical protein